MTRVERKKFKVFVATAKGELDALWTALLATDMEFKLRHSEEVSAKI